MNTLLPWQEKRAYAQISSACMLSKVQLLEDQFVKAGWDVIGIQEGRATAAVSKSGHSYIMLAAPACEDGSCGVQLWVRCGITVLAWEATSPRVMHAILSKRGVQFGVVVGHAPHSMGDASAAARRAAWWDALTERCSALRRKYCMDWLVLLDANGRVGATASPAIGPSNPEPENENGSHLRVFAEQLDFCIGNTWGPEAGYTWTSSKKTRSRIDYVLFPAHLASPDVVCRPNYEVDLTLNAWEDHCPVEFVLDISEHARAAPVVPCFQVNKCYLQCPQRVAVFQRLLWLFPHVPSRVHLDDHLEMLNIYTRWCAGYAFGAPSQQPRQKWISPQVWEYLQHVAPLRRHRHSLWQQEQAHTARFWLVAWRYHTVSASRADGLGNPTVPGGSFYTCAWCRAGRPVISNVLGGSSYECTCWRHALRRPLALQGSAIDCYRALRTARWCGACAHATIFRIQRFIQPVLHADRLRFLDSLAASAAQSMGQNDTRQAYAVIRCLSGARYKPTPCVFLKDGSVTSDPLAVRRRWLEHFSEVLGGVPTSDSALREPPRMPHDLPTSLDVGPVATLASFAALGRNKGVGYDRIPAELLQAGGSPIACLFSQLNQRVVATAAWPRQWRGGRLQEVWKKKGDARLTDSSRGVLLADHSGKALAGAVKSALDPVYRVKVPETQFGAVPHRGTDEATLLIRAAMELAALRNFSIVVLFIDLVKAFDKVIREIVFGWGPQPPSDPVAALVGLGVSPNAAAWIARYIAERGHLFEQWAVDPTAAALCQSLHAGAWFGVEGTEERVASRTGGRQGCKLGALTFNSVYTVGLDLLRWALEQDGLTLRLPVPSSPFWGHPDSTVYADADASIIDATFVDDECVVLMAARCSDLDRAIDRLLCVLYDTFDSLHLEINPKPGKTEALLRYRGYGATAAREARRGSDGRLRLAVPNRPGVSIDVVASYAHLGTFASIDGDTFRNSTHRCASALAAYAPLAFKIFSSALVPLLHKFAFNRTLVLSRLLFGVHLTRPQPRALRKLNGVYMRVLRRIAGDSRYSTDVKWTDLQVRQKLDQPSIDCLIARSRLLLWGRLVRNQPRHVLALLHVRVGQRQLPWVEQLLTDADTLCRQCCPPGFPYARDDPNQWEALLKDEVRWSALVSRLAFHESCCDREVHSNTPVPGMTWTCAECSRSFASARALKSHRRAKHGERSQLRCLLGSAVCPCCGTNFVQRLRLLAHVSDARRPRCREWILSNCSPLPPEEVARLDAEDQRLRREAQRAGRSHHIAVGPATTTDGRSVGRVNL